ncbi:DptB.2 family protein [Megaselia abdita]
MNFKILCVFAALAVIASAYPSDPINQQQDEAEIINQIVRIRRNPEEKTTKKPEPEFRFKAKVEDSKQDGRSLQGQTQWRAWESENGRHKVETYADGYVREGGDKYRFQPNNQRDSNYRVGGTYEYKCC